MNDEQPEALRLADALDHLDVRGADRIQNCASAASELRRLYAAELRRLYCYCVKLQAENEVLLRRAQRAEARCNEFLETLRHVAAIVNFGGLVKMDEWQVDVIVRKLTRYYCMPESDKAEARARVLAAIAKAEET